MVDPAYNWTGFLRRPPRRRRQLDGALTTQDTGFAFNDQFTNTFRKTGFIAGGQIGYNYQSGMSAVWLRSRCLLRLNVKSSFSGP